MGCAEGAKEVGDGSLGGGGRRRWCCQDAESVLRTGAGLGGEDEEHLLETRLLIGWAGQGCVARGLDACVETRGKRGDDAVAEGAEGGCADVDGG